MPNGMKPGMCNVPEDKRIQPGEVRNPTGQLKSMSKEIRESFRVHTIDALEVLVEVMKNPKARNFDRVRAAEIILDRGWGKPQQSVDIDLAANVPIIFSELLNDKTDNETRTSIEGPEES